MPGWGLALRPAGRCLIIYMSMLQEFINKHFYELFIFTFIFGLLLYGTIGFDGIDEICALLLFLLFGYTVLKTDDWYVNRAFLVTVGIFLFYLGYSFFIGSNTKKGIIMDFIIQSKPYLAFFAVYYMSPIFGANQKSILRIICVFAWLLLLLLGIMSLFIPYLIDKVMFHQAFYAACITAIALIYLYCGTDTKKDKLMFILILTTGIFSTRSKFYGFYMLAVLLTLLSPWLKNFKFNLKTVLVILGVVAAIVVVGWQKIDLYFAISGDVEDVESGLVARLMLYMTSLEVLVDYFPFGSGFASFASYASGVYYSDLYVKYGLDKVWGINSTDYSFIADTYYPCLAQFGVVGVLLYAYFIFFILRKAYLLFKRSHQTKYLMIPLLIIGYFLIESIADATFTGHRGYFMMMLLGLVLSEHKYYIQRQEGRLPAAKS